MKISDIIAAGDVKRWHIMNMTRDQTLAEHQWMVTMLAREIGIRAELENYEIGVIVDVALIHDMDEIWGGDPPNVSPANEIVHKLNNLNEIKACVKFADLIDAAIFSRENCINRRSELAANQSRNRLVAAFNCKHIKIAKAAEEVYNECYPG